MVKMEIWILCWITHVICARRASAGTCKLQKNLFEPFDSTYGTAIESTEFDFLRFHCLLFIVSFSPSFHLPPRFALCFFFYSDFIHIWMHEWVWYSWRDLKWKVEMTIFLKWRFPIFATLFFCPEIMNFSWKLRRVLEKSNFPLSKFHRCFWSQPLLPHKTLFIIKDQRSFRVISLFYRIFYKKLNCDWISFAAHYKSFCAFSSIEFERIQFSHFQTHFSNFQPYLIDQFKKFLI